MITGKTKITGIFGYPIEHSLSPIMHNAAFKKLGLDFVYLPFLVAKEDLSYAVRSIKILNIVGVNVTVPHKENVIQYLDELTPEAKAIGAVNTICNIGGRLIGDNTDGRGFLASLQEEGNFNPQGKNVFLMGAGGAAHAIGTVLVKVPVNRLWINDLISSKAPALKQHLQNQNKKVKIEVISVNDKKLKKILKETHLFINATPVGMNAGDGYVIAPGYVHKKMFIYDIVYNLETPLIKQAKKIGAKFLTGIGMLVYQGALSFQLWTGKKAPIEVMRQALVNPKTRYASLTLGRTSLLSTS